MIQFNVDMISIVIPVYNESESLELLFNELVEVLMRWKNAYEILFIDDGSTDGSLELLKNLSQKEKHVKVFSFRKNQGKAEALMFGFQKAVGDVIVTLDADLQDKPQEIKNLLSKLNGKYDVVCGWRKNRQDPSTKIISSKLFNFLASQLWGLHLHDYNCGLKAYTKDAAKSLRLYGGMHRFIPLIAHQQGFKVTEVAIEHEKRKYGKSKYGFSKLWKDMPDIFTMIFLSRYSERPLHFFGAIGGLFFLIGFLISLYLSILHFQGIAIGDRPLLFLGVLLLVLGFQVFFTGFLADLILNISKNDIQNSLSPIKYSSEKE